MIVDQLFNHKLIKEGEVYDLGREYGSPPPEKKKRSQDPDDYNPYPYSPEEDEDYFREIFRKKREAAKNQGVTEMDKSQKGAPGWNISDDEPGGKEYYGKAAKAKDVVKKGAKALDKAFNKTHSKKTVKESRLDEAMLMEDPVYRKFKGVGRYIAERKMSEKEILQVFADAEAGMTNKGTGANRTMLGRGKDTTMDFAGGVKDAVTGVLNSIQNSTPVAAVDVAYDQATDALADLAGGQKGQVMDAIKKYRNLVKEYPKTAGFAKAALVAIAGLATGGAGLPAIAGLTYALDSAIKGDKLSSVIGKGAGAAALSAAGQAAHSAMNQPGAQDTFDPGTGNDWGGDTAVPGGDGSIPGQFAGGQYTVQNGDQIGYIAQAQGVKAQDIIDLNPQIDFSKPIHAGDVLNLPPQGDGAGSLWQGYKGAYGDKVPGSVSGDELSGRADNINNMLDKANAGAGSGQGLPDHPSAASDYGTGKSAPIDYSQPGPVSTDSLGQKLEYGMPVNDKGSFIPPNPKLPAEELATQQAAYDTWKADFMKRFPDATQLPDGTMQSVKPGLAPMQIMQKPTLPATNIGGEAVVPGQPLTPDQMTAADIAISMGNQLPPDVQAAYNLAKQAQVKESIKFKIIPADKLIDQKSTVLAWALNESVGRKSKSVSLTTQGTYTVFENINRYRKAILEYTQPGRPELPDQYRPDMPGGAGVQSKPGLIGRGLNALDRGVKKVGGALGNFGHQFTTGVTKEKLKMNWHQAGKPSDSDALAAWLVKQGVPQDVVTSVYGKMGIPYTAPATTGGAQRQAYAGTNPATGKPWTVDELQARMNPTVAPTATPATTTTTTTSATGTFPGEDPKGPGYVGRREVARRQAARDAEAAKKPAAPNFAQQGGGYKSVNYAPNIKTGINLPKPTAPATPAPTGTKVTTGGPTPDEQAKLAQRIAQATAQPVAEMLQMVETKEDVQKIKQFVDQTFAKYGAVNESAFAVRNKIIEHVTQVGAQRRREYARKGA